MSEDLSTSAGGRLRERREAVVREHMESENEHDFDTTIGTFAHPRYEIIPTGDVYDGEAEVRRYFAETRNAFPDQRNELIALHHADDAVIVEFYLLGTHLGPLRSLPPTGRSFRCRMTAFFFFEDDRIVGERVYFDQATILRQLGLAHDPSSLAGRASLLASHPVTIGRTVLNALRSRL
ncbi:MAG: ester cyclase [Solirubrobacterales bacterium]|nr:ester cyclase [Solirubrobacterales bacterium]